MVARVGENARVKSIVYLRPNASHDTDMAWIKTIPRALAGGSLAQGYAELDALYPPEYARDVPALLQPDGTMDSVTEAHSLIPEAMRHGMATLGVLLSPDLPLTRRQHEMIATFVSALNSCFY